MFDNMPLQVDQSTAVNNVELLITAVASAAPSRVSGTALATPAAFQAIVLCLTLCTVLYCLHDVVV